jgi:hypothetical protein
MAQRLDLQTLLETFVDNVYFQPPTNVKLVYPCIIYTRDFAKTEFANDKPYNSTLRYKVMIIDSNPDSDIPSKVASLPMCLFNRFFTADNLNHDVYNLYF